MPNPWDTASTAVASPPQPASTNSDNPWANAAAAGVRMILPSKDMTFTQKLFSPISFGYALDTAAMGPFNELLQRGSEANLARAARGWKGPTGAIHTLLHSEPISQYKSDTDRKLQEIENARWLGGGQGAAHDITGYGPWHRAIDEIAVQTLYDPTVILGKLGLGEKAVFTAEKAALPAALRFSDALGRGAVSAVSRVNPGLGEALSGHLQGAASLAGLAHDAVGVDSQIKRYLAARNPAGWVEDYSQWQTIRGAMRNQKTAATEIFHNELDDAFRPFNDRQRMSILRALNADRIDLLPTPELRAAAQRVSNWTDSLAHIQGTKGLQTLLRQGGFQLPEYAQPFAGSVRSLQKSTQYRKGYITLPHDTGDSTSPEWQKALEEVYEKATGRPIKFTELRKVDPNLMSREERGLVNDPQMYIDAMKNRASMAFDTAFTRDALRDFARMSGVKRIDRIPKPIIKPMTTEFRPRSSMGEWEGRMHDFGQLLAKWTDFGKSPLFFLAQPHQANILSLLMQHEPSVVLSALSRYHQIKDMAPLQRLAALDRAVKTGAVSLHSFERQTPFVEALKGMGPVGKAIAGHYERVGTKLWAMDDAAKSAYQDYLIANKGMSPQRAALEVQSSLVDYSTLSPIGSALRKGFFPFATWATKMPVAVARGLLKHPENAALATRIAPALGGDSQKLPSMKTGFGTIGGNTVKSYLPMAEAQEIATDPYRWLRSRLSPTLKAGASLAGLQPQGYHGKNYFSYGINPLLYGAEESTPAIGTLLQYAGFGPFPSKKKVIDKLKSIPMSVLTQILESVTRTYPTVPK